MQSDVRTLADSWNGIDTLVVYGLGLVAERFIDKIIQDFKVPYIIDHKKQGKTYHDIPIVSYETVKSELKQKDTKIVVMTSQRVYSEIRGILEADGLAEMEDFCRIEQFAVEWYYTNRKMINIIQTNTAVTTWCSLNCEKCNMFIPYYDNEKRRHHTFSEMKEDIDILLSFADYIFTYTFLGGEPFLNKEIKDIVSYVGSTYSERIGRLGITTNGTIIPDEETLHQLKKYHVAISISDYTAVVPYQEKMDAFTKTLDQWGIYYIKNVMTEWKDFGFPNQPFHWGKDGVYEHMKNCSPFFHGINDKKLYYCHIIWSAERAGIYTVPKQDYLDLTELDSGKEEDRIRVSRYSMGDCERGFLGFCMVCGGCGEDNTRIIPAGVQKKRCD